MTTSLMRPLPMSRPTVVDLRPKSPITCPLVEESSGYLVVQRATDVPHKLHFGNPLRGSGLTSETTHDFIPPPGLHLLFRKRSLGMQQWAGQRENCNRWHRIARACAPSEELNPTSFRLNRTARRKQAHQRSAPAARERPAGAIILDSPRPNQKQRAGQARHRPAGLYSRCWLDGAEVQGRCADGDGSESRRRETRRRLREP